MIYIVSVFSLTVIQFINAVVVLFIKIDGHFIQRFFFAI